MQQPQYDQNSEGNWCWPPSLRKSGRSRPSSLQFGLQRARKKLNVKCFISYFSISDGLDTFIKMLNKFMWDLLHF